MSPELQQYLPLIIVGALLLLIALWLLIRTNRKTRVTGERAGDVLDEGAQGAQRNQALIDAPRSVEKEYGQTSANANTQEVAAAQAQTDAEAGAFVAPSAPASTPATASPPAPTPDPASAPAPAPVASSTPSSSGQGDDLTRIKGLGPKLSSRLAELGVTRFDQIANWSAEDIERIDPQLGRFSGRIARDQWVAQARLLAEGDEAGFSERFGNTR